MKEQNARLSVIAYYFSKFDINAVRALGYESRAAAISDISMKVGNDNNYLKLRRDEFDVLTGSHRRGYANREPIRSVLEMHNHLKDINFDDFTDIVSQLINPLIPVLARNTPENTLPIDSNFSDAEIEAIINAIDIKSTIILQQAEHRTRIYNSNIITNLKKLYRYRCQICGYSAQEYDVHIVEAHHILSFSETQNNNSENIIIICPNHHRIIHCANAVFDREKKSFTFSNKTEMSIEINLHL